ncbi:hypothetical protein LMJF_24_0430 [Leishmania major strain Friedlin]|uniref:Uncharacterized protein n=1 Tax=Leishmania major TaxID=5664 RepID=Q4QAT8_LEIMA|nr:hypothetical protein LMJF_24_0430 [Leishmania major strain Friedlin]CAJ04235.1 hypothetical protein LMJF_24_0430 [Leishmania major strain Friedlin]|eukprot:XP_001683560.1 hypothetical protein LMJF_24_0430 [Leishmania major strain Friedlin]
MCDRADDSRTRVQAIMCAMHEVGEGDAATKTPPPFCLFSLLLGSSGFRGVATAGPTERLCALPQAQTLGTSPSSRLPPSLVPFSCPLVPCSLRLRLCVCLRRHTPVPFDPLLPSRTCALPPRAPPPPALHRTKTCLAYLCCGLSLSNSVPHPFFFALSQLDHPNASMRRLAPLLTTAPSLSSVVLNVSSAYGGARAVSPCRTMTTMAVCEASSDALTTFTSFEVESELSLAQDDLEQLQLDLQSVRASSNASASARTRHASTPSPSRLAASSSVSLTPPPMKISVASTPSLRCPPLPLGRPQPVVLPALLQRPRWRNVVHERYRASVPGYVDACAQVLGNVRNMWEVCAANRRRREEASDSCFAEHVSTLLRHAHADALLVLLEGVAGAHHGGDVFADGAALFRCELILHLVRSLARRPVELSGKHMAHLSKLLLSCPQLLTAAPPSQNYLAQALVAEVQEEVWSSFTCLCYATRRSLRRRQNVDCLEALLCGVYMRAHHEPATLQSSGRDSRTSRLVSAMLRSCVDARDGGWQRRYAGHPLPPHLLARVRQAALCHLVHRCLLSGAVAKVGAAEKANEENARLLLSWALLLAREDMDPVVHAAVVYRLSRGPGLAEGGSPAGASPACVESWRRLALLVEAVRRPSRLGEQRATAPANGAEAFQGVDQACKDTRGWAVLSVDRRQLGALCAQTHAPLSLWSATGPVVSRGVEAARARTRDAAVQRVSDGAAAALRAYVRLRWEPLSISEAEQLLPDDAALAVSVALTEGARREAPTSITERMIAEECEDVIESAADMPPHAVCLAEVLCVRLLRSMQRWKGTSLGGVIAPPASSGTAQASPAVLPASQQRRVLAALWKLSAYARAEVVTAALLELQGEAGTTAAAGKSGNVHSDPSCTAPSSALMGPSMPPRACWPLIGAVCRHAEDVVHVTRELMSHREMMAAPLSLASLQRLREWLVGLPGSLHSAHLVKVLREWAEIEKSKLSGASSRAQECLTAWDDVVRTALEQHAAHALLAALDGQCAAAAVTTGPCCSPCGEELRSTYAVMTGPASAQLRRIQWIAEANSSAVREWRWSMGVASPLIGRTTVGRSASLLHPASALPAAVLAVEATELDLTDTEHDAAVRLLCQRCFSDLSGSNTFSWSDRLACRALERAQATSTPTTQLGVRIDEDLAADHSSAADGDADAPSCPSKQCKGTIVSAAALHYLLTRGNPTTSSATATAPMFSTAELGDALHTLSVYVEFLVKTRRSGVYDDPCSERAINRRLRCAAAAYVNCLSDAWRVTLRTIAPPTSAVPLHVADEEVLLMCFPAFYHCALRLYDRLLSDKAVLDKGSDEVLMSLPCLSGALHEAAFRALVRTSGTRRRNIETTLLLADRVARQWAALGMVSSSSSVAHAAVASAPSLTDDQPAFCVPLSVYQLVLATYAADRTPLPQRVRACCEAALRREEKRQWVGPS